MLLVCPECRARYVVPDSAIGANGRQVRCANCRHSWFQAGMELPPAPPAPAIVAPPVAPARQEDSAPSPSAAAEAVPTAPGGSDTAVADESFPHPGFTTFARPVAEEQAPATADLPPVIERPEAVEAVAPPTFAMPADPVVERSQFAHEPPFRPRRNPAKLWTYAAIAFAMIVAAIGAATWYSGWLDNSFGASVAEPDLKIVLHDNLELGRDADGSPYFIASGSIVNPTAQAQKVPELLVTLKDSSGRPVYSWTMKAPVRTLAPGAKADFSQLRRDVPLAASRISVGWALGG